MDIAKIKEGSGLVVKPSGRIDISNATEFGKEVEEALDGIVDLVIDFKDIVYISSAGLRTILDIGKTMDAKNGTLRLANMSSSVLDVFKMTGFDKILTII